MIPNKTNFIRYKNIQCHICFEEQKLDPNRFTRDIETYDYMILYEYGRINVDTPPIVMEPDRRNRLSEPKTEKSTAIGSRRDQTIRDRGSCHRSNMY